MRHQPGVWVCVLLLSFSCALSAAVYPEKAVRIIVPYPPAGPTDILARTIGEKLSIALGQAVLIDNRAGAGGVIGSDLAAKAAPDGYVILWGTSGSHAIGATLHPRLPYDPVKDFAPITLVAKGANILVVHPSLPVRSVKDLVALARSNRGRMNFASAGNGATSHLAGETFKLHGGAPITHVPYKGAAPAITSLISGEVEMAILDVPALLPHIRSGKLRALGKSRATVGGEERVGLVDLLHALCRRRQRLPEDPR